MSENVEIRELEVWRKPGLASVRVLELSTEGRGAPIRVEAVESVQPPLAADQKWVLILSTFTGCPVGCAFCDAGATPGRPLSAAEILAQAEHLVDTRHPDRILPQDKFKVQFARMGEPALNPAVLDALRALPRRFQAPGLLPSLSTVAPRGRDAFFEELLRIRDEGLFPWGMQLQFSIHSTDPAARRRLVPIPTWSLEQMARWGRRFHQPGQRLVTLNFAPARHHPVDPEVVARHFDPEQFLVKLTPLNPTERQAASGLVSEIDGNRPQRGEALARSFEHHGFRCILSIGELEENAIGSNCGQYVTRQGAPEVRVRPGYRSPAYAVAD